MSDEFIIENTKESDYPEFCRWWKSWKKTPVPQEVLPDNGRNGVLISYKGQKICAGFIYATSSPVLFHFEWVISNFDVKDRKIRKLALITLIDSASKFIKEAGGKLVYTSLKEASLIGHYEECGYQKGSTTCTEMVKSLY